MFFDESALAPAPRRGGGGNTVGKEAVDAAGQEILQVFGLVGRLDDVAAVGRVRNERVDPVIGIKEAGDDAEPKLLVREHVEHLLDGLERIAPARPPGKNQN